MQAIFSLLSFSAQPILFAQESFDTDFGSQPELGAGFGIGQFVFIAIFYVIGSFLCQKIYEKTGVENPWFAWIPILGTYANFQAGDDENPLLWTILSLIPCVNIAAVVKLIMAWIKICGKLGKTPWILLLCLIPLFGPIITLGILAYA